MLEPITPVPIQPIRVVPGAISIPAIASYTLAFADACGAPQAPAALAELI
jgi:hypothetical protein